MDQVLLAKWKTELEKEKADIEVQLRPLLIRRDEVTGKLDAVNRLLGSNGRGENPAAAAPVHPIPPSGAPAPTRKPRFTPVGAYWIPTLEAVEELGGRAASEQVISLVGKKLSQVLTPADKELLPSGVDVRWQNRVAWQRANMKQRGLLRDDSPRGIWEITEAGKQWLQKQKQLAG